MDQHIIYYINESLNWVFKNYFTALNGETIEKSYFSIFSNCWSGER